MYVLVMQEGERLPDIFAGSHRMKQYDRLWAGCRDLTRKGNDRAWVVQVVGLILQMNMHTSRTSRSLEGGNNTVQPGGVARLIRASVAMKWCDQGDV